MARDPARSVYTVTDLEALDRRPGLDHLATEFVSEHAAVARREPGPALLGVNDTCATLEVTFSDGEPDAFDGDQHLVVEIGTNYCIQSQPTRVNGNNRSIRESGRKPP